MRWEESENGNCGVFVRHNHWRSHTLGRNAIGKLKVYGHAVGAADAHRDYGADRVVGIRRDRRIGERRCIRTSNA
jgi:hypothetical protein